MKKLPKGEAHKKDLLRGGGALNSWAQKIVLALALGLINENDARDLEVLKAMRNACAHSRRPIDFSTPALADVFCLLLNEKGAEAFKTGSPFYRRYLFLFVTTYIWAKLSGRARRTGEAVTRQMILRHWELAEKLDSSPRKRLPPRQKAGSPKDRKG